MENPEFQFTQGQPLNWSPGGGTSSYGGTTDGETADKDIQDCLSTDTDETRLSEDYVPGNAHSEHEVQHFSEGASHLIDSSSDIKNMSILELGLLASHRSK